MAGGDHSYAARMAYRILDEHLLEAHVHVLLYTYIYLYKHGQGLGPSGGLLGRFPGPGMRFSHFEGQIMDKFEMGSFPIPWMGHLELHFRLFEVSRP